MLDLKFVAFLLVAVALFVYVIRNTAPWAKRMQNNYVEESKKMGMESSRWTKPSINLLFRFGIVFSTLILIGIAYSALFGSVGQSY